jgi:polyamine oxidase
MDMDRRKFIRLYGMASFLLMLGFTSGRTPRLTAKSNRVIVIGAGMSGLSSARALHDAGYQVTIFEGRDRIGGRIRTTRDLSTPVDLGAGWIHGEVDNPLTDLAEKYGAKLFKTEMNNIAGLGKNGTDLTDGMLELASRAYEIMAREPSNKDSKSLGQFVRDELGSLNAEQTRMLNGFLGAQGGFWGSNSLNEIDRFQLNQEKTFEGYDWRFLNGYDTIIRGLAEGLDIRLGAAVTTVDWSGPTNRVETKQGVYEAEHVIVSTPVAVLRQGGIRFTPDLPSTHETAIQELAVGLSEKLVLRFQKPFWPEAAHLLVRASDDGNFPLMFNNHYPSSGDAFLTIRVLGDRVPHWTTLDQSSAVAEAMKMLKNTFGSDIPNPTAALQSDWYRNPFSQGGYSTNHIDVPSYEHRAQLAKPVSPGLQFVGEHTEPDYFATVHGAYLSGQRAATFVTSANRQDA